jgi:hypothetical protein
MSSYELLHYRGDVTSRALVGQILGCDEFGRPFEIIDAEYQPEVDTTTVFLQYATAETLRAAQAVTA